ncbi:hypothetical protein LEM8419_02961 [Neolewinella maritima]|uniref:DUF4382 domain-containing protein n=1 Tax=Neolewinella maritima TaxID=1383882 RepID=A0ABN8FD14_9BACT|nr:hypothetical protein [Neolewinella maritima]CAH1002046.1 hypothetical protein LEM8419_02961 [Neolewinella maritima]
MKLPVPNCFFGLLFLLLAVSCSTTTESIDYILGEGQLRLEIANTVVSETTPAVTTVLTVADVRIDGVSLPGFRRQTIQWGGGAQAADVLYNGSIASGSYELVELILDPGTDDQGSGPGCYTVDANGQKHALDIRAGGLLSIPTYELVVDRNEYVSGLLSIQLAKALQPQTASGTYTLQANRWHRKWATYIPQESQLASSR